MSIKKTLAGIASYALVGAVALGIGGSLAFQNDETVSADNTWVVGDIEIEQLEYQREEGVSHINESAKEGELVPFVQDKLIMPAVPLNNLATDYSAEKAGDRQFYWGYYTGGNGSNGLWDDSKLSNVMDKFVFVKNTGENDCYYRTVIAFECPEGATYGEAGDGADFMLNVNGNERFTWKTNGYTEIDGTRYLLMTATYRDALTSGETSRPSLLQVVMTHHADNALVNSLGDEYEIKVVSQAVQLSGFEDATNGLTAAEMLERAFGKVTPETNPWVATPVSNAEGLKAALAEGGQIVITDDVVVDEVLTISENTTLTINGDFDASAVVGRPFNIADGAELVINAADDSEIKVGTYGLVNVPEGSGNVSVTLNGGNYVGNTDNGAFIKLRPGAGDATIVLNDVNYTDESDDGFLLNKLEYTGTMNMEINGGSFKAHAGFQAKNATIRNATITTDGSAFEFHGENVVENCTLNIAPGSTVGTGPAAAIAASSNGKVSVTGCTITGNMAAVYYIYSSGGTIIANGNDITGVADGVATYKSGLDLKNYPDADEYIEIDNKVMVD